MTMATQKRAHEEVDPDYPDACAQLIKRQKEVEQDAKQAVTRRVQNIVRNEFQKEINYKEAELQQIDRRLNEARLMMDRLRACVVANYYGRANLEWTSQTSSVNAPPPSVHPAVKKCLGKMPANQITYSESVTLHQQRENKFSAQNKDLNDLSGSREDKNNIKLQSISTHLTDEDKSQDLMNTHRSSVSATMAPVSSTASGATYDDRRARTKIKKKIIIGNVSKYIPVDHREPSDMSSHKWMVYVRGPKSDPDISAFVKKVWFFLHHSFKPNDLVEISSPPFHLTRRGWGEFPVRVQLHFVDPRNKKVDIIHHLKLDKAFTGLQSLGAETSVEVELERDFFESADNTVTPTSTSSQALNVFSPSVQVSLEEMTALSSESKDTSSTQADCHEKVFIKSEPSESCTEKESSKCEFEIDSAARTHEKRTGFEDFHMTIAHDTGECEEIIKPHTEEEMVVDVGEESNEPSTQKITTKTAVTSLTPTKDQTSNVDLVLSCDTRDDPLPVGHQTLCINTINTPVLETSRGMPCAQHKSQTIRNSHIRHMKLSNAVQNVIISPVSLLQQNVSSASVVSSQPLTTVTTASLSDRIGIRSSEANPSHSQSIIISQPTGIKNSSLLVPAVPANSSPQVPHPYSSATSVQSALTVSKATVVPTTTVVLSQTTQPRQTSLRTSSTQKVIILQPTLTRKADSTGLMIKSTSDSKSLVTSKSGPRQVSLLTGRIVTPQTNTLGTSWTNEISILNNQRVCASSSQPTASYSGQGNGQSKSRQVSGLPQSALKVASGLLKSSSPLSSSSSSPSSSASPIITLTPAFSQSSNSGGTGQAAETGNSNTSSTNPHTLVTQQSKQQISLLNSSPASYGPNVMITQKNQPAVIRPMIISLSGNVQLPQVTKQDAKSSFKMSAIGKTKHGCASSQLLSKDKSTPTAEERKRNQYEILKTWRENPELYQRNAFKNKKIVLAVKDMIEGEADVIPELNPSDYPTMRSFLKAAVRLHPLVQDGVNKLTHPYCAESIDQWNSWTIGKQRASEWHRACFVLKYLKSCLGNQSEFKEEKLMTTRQLVTWCRHHALSPIVKVTKTKTRPEMQDTDLATSQTVEPNNYHIPSYTPVAEVDTELSPEIISCLKRNTDEEDMDLDILEVNTEIRKEKGVRLELHSLESGVKWLSPSEGACFVHEQLRKRGIKTQPLEVTPRLLGDSVTEILFKTMLEFGSDILAESLAAAAETSEFTQVTRQDVYKALTRIPEATFCCNKFLGKNVLNEDSSGRDGSGLQYPDIHSSFI